MVRKIISWIFARLFPKFFIICPFLIFLHNDHYLPTKLFKSRRWDIWQNFRDKKWFLTFFTAKLKTFILPSHFFLNDLFTNDGSKLEVSESNPIMESIPLSLSLSVRVSFLLFLVHVLSLFLWLSLSLSLSLFLFLFLMPHLSCCYLAYCHYLWSSLTLSYSWNVFTKYDFTGILKEIIVNCSQKQFVANTLTLFVSLCNFSLGRIFVWPILLSSPETGYIGSAQFASRSLRAVQPTSLQVCD